MAVTLCLHKLINTWNTTVERYICLNEFAATTFKNSSLKVTEEKIVVKPNWTHNQYQTNNIGKQEHFLFVGRLSHEKGVPFLLKAFEKIGKKLWIAGSGPLNEKMKNLPSNIVYLGALEKGEVVQQMAKAKAVLLPSCWYEMFPMIIIEAFSVGTPIIATRIGGLPGIINHGTNGLLFEKGNEKDLLEKVLSLDDCAFYNRLCCNAQKTFKAKYTDTVAIDNLFQIYKPFMKETVIPAKVC
ncbi:glycosyltransferase family 4 protein [Cellulosispirillum alkaliphilum]|uniref:glycosyltransferase family 4 protein n=1 Tax=Cellulosispirillum alkaliphilum TaxID=3039283 RepID=UPI003D6EB881